MRVIRWDDRRVWKACLIKPDPGGEHERGLPRELGDGLLGAYDYVFKSFLFSNTDTMDSWGLMITCLSGPSFYTLTSLRTLS